MVHTTKKNWRYVISFLALIPLIVGNSTSVGCFSSVDSVSPSNNSCMSYSLCNQTYSEFGLKCFSPMESIIPSYNCTSHSLCNQTCPQCDLGCFSPMDYVSPLYYRCTSNSLCNQTCSAYDLGCFSPMDYVSPLYDMCMSNSLCNQTCSAYGLRCFSPMDYVSPLCDTCMSNSLIYLENHDLVLIEDSSDANFSQLIFNTTPFVDCRLKGAAVAYYAPPTKYLLGLVALFLSL